MLSLTLFKIISVTIPSPPSGFSLWEDQDVPLREESGGTPCKPRRLNFLLLLEIAPNKKLTLTVSPGLRPHIGKKMVSLIAFRQNLPRTLPAACIFSYTIMTYLKSFDGTKSLNAKQYPSVLTT